MTREARQGLQPQVRTSIVLETGSRNDQGSPSGIATARLALCQLGQECVEMTREARQGLQRNIARPGQSALGVEMTREARQGLQPLSETRIRPRVLLRRNDQGSPSGIATPMTPTAATTRRSVEMTREARQGLQP